MEDIRVLIAECKALIEQTEPYQRKMKAKHSRLKKRVIGRGGQANVPPFTKKPSTKRSKSAPPMGEAKKEQLVSEVVREELIKYLIEEGWWDKAKKYAAMGAIAGTMAAPIGYAAKGMSDIESARQQQIQQNVEDSKPTQDFINTKKQFDITSNSEQQLIKNIIEKYELLKSNDVKIKNNADKIANNVIDKLSFNKDVSAAANMQALEDVSTLLKMTNPNMSKSEILFKAFEILKYGKKDEAVKMKKDLNINTSVNVEIQHPVALPLQETIRKKGSQYCLYSKKSNKNLGCYSSKEGAKKRERQVQYFKHAK